MPDRPNVLYKIWIVLAALLLALPLSMLTCAAAEAIAILLRSRRSFGSWPAALEDVIAGVWQ